MNECEYKNMFDNEDYHPWYRHLRKLSTYYLNRYCSKPPEECRVLDVGCGTGGELAYLLKNAPSLKIVAMDHHPLAIELTKRRDLRISLVRANLDNLPFKDNYFDVILCLDVLYMEGIQIDQSLASLYQCLKPGGILISNAAAFDCFRGPHDLMVATAHRFTREEMIKKIRGKGFAVLKASYWNTFLAPILFIKRRLMVLAGHTKAKSDLYRLPAIFSWGIALILMVEGFLFKRINLSFGTSVFVVAQRPLEEVL